MWARLLLTSREFGGAKVASFGHVCVTLHLSCVSLATILHVWYFEFSKSSFFPCDALNVVFLGATIDTLMFGSKVRARAIELVAGVSKSMTSNDLTSVL